MHPKDTIFAKIVDGTLTVDKLHEDSESIAFRDINPQAPIHVLIIPKAPLAGSLPQLKGNDGAGWWL